MKFGGTLKRFHMRTWPPTKHLDTLNFDAIEIQHVIQIHVLLLSGYLFATFLMLLETFIAKRRRKLYNRRLRIIEAFPVYQRDRTGEIIARNDDANIFEQIQGIYCMQQ